MKIYIGADHRGFELKEKIARWLFEWGYEFTDMGADTYDEKDDYTKYATSVASLVAENKNSLGILLCGSGIGMSVAANKFDGVRAAIGIDTEQVIAGRKHDDINLLTIAADHTDEHKAKEMLKVFLETDFDNLARHKKRLEDIIKIEENN